MSEFDLNGAHYRIKKLNAIEQWHLNRKIAPLVPPLIPVFLRIARTGDASNDIEGVADILGPFAEGIAGMSDEASEFVINTCLSAVEREVAPGVWQKIWISSSRISPFQEINDLSNAMNIVIKVIWEVLGPFIQGLVAAQQSKTTDSPT